MHRIGRIVGFWFCPTPPLAPNARKCTQCFLWCQWFCKSQIFQNLTALICKKFAGLKTNLCSKQDLESQLCRYSLSSQKCILRKTHPCDFKKRNHHRTRYFHILLSGTKLVFQSMLERVSLKESWLISELVISLCLKTSHVSVWEVVTDFLDHHYWTGPPPPKIRWPAEQT